MDTIDEIKAGETQAIYSSDELIEYTTIAAIGRVRLSESQDRLVRAKATAIDGKAVTDDALDPLATVPPTDSLIAKSRTDSKEQVSIFKLLNSLTNVVMEQTATQGKLTDILTVIGTRLEKMQQDLFDHQTKVMAMEKRIEKASSTPIWQNIGMAVITIAIGVAVGGMVGGPAGIAAALVAGVVTVALGSQIKIGDKPLMNWILEQTVGSDGALDGRSPMNALAHLVASEIGDEVGLNEKQQLMLEGGIELAFTVLVAVIAGGVTSAYISSITRSATTAATNTAAQGTTTGTTRTTTTAASSSGGWTNAALRIPGSTYTTTPNALIRGISMFAQIMTSMLEGQKDTVKLEGKDGEEPQEITANSINKILLGAGMKQDDAAYVTMAIQGALMIMQTAGMLSMGSMPGAASKFGLFSKGLQYLGQVTPWAEAAIQTEQTVKNVQVMQAYGELAPEMEKLVIAQGRIDQTRDAHATALEALTAGTNTLTGDWQIIQELLRAGGDVSKLMFQA